MAAAASPNSRPTVVGIGASAGGLAALKTFLSDVPPDSGLTFVVVVHLLPDHESHMAEILQPHVRFPVLQVTDDTRLAPNHVYVIPPNCNISSIDTHLRLSRLEERRQERAPIDHFFRTLADAHDGHAVAVVLSGTGSDGTLGVRDIKANGGLVIVQDPKEAEYDGMPQSAIATGLVDLILPVSEIPAVILRYDRTRPRLPDAADEPAAPQSEPALLNGIFALLRAGADRDFSCYKRSTLLRRIARRMQLNYIEDLERYVDRLREKPEELSALAEDLLVTVTHFFRDPEVFAKLEKEEIPRLFAGKEAHDVVRVWSVGCATGDEAYSLAMLLEEEAERRHPYPAFQVFASDLHTCSLEIARAGFYVGDIESDVTADRLKRFFTKEGGGYRVRKELRDRVIFAPHNLLADPPFSRLDLICCRNLLIFLERGVQRDVMQLFHYALNPDGTLLLGSAEALDSADLFRTIDKKLCLFRKRNVPEPHLPVFRPRRLKLHGPVGFHPMPAAPVTFGHMHQQMLEELAPLSILIGPDNRAVHFSETAGRYLQHPGGEPTENVVKLVRNELRIELQSLLQQGREKKRNLDSKPILVQFNGHPRPVVMHVRPAVDPSREGFILVIFEEREPSEEGPSGALGTAEARIRDLEAELGSARQRLQTIIEEYEGSQEEMKASSEEMQSVNEELRSTMEELETSKEELQSVNEELQTVNQQNQHKVQELAQLTNDLQNLLSSVDIATLFLDRELRIQRFTEKLTGLFNIRSTDRGRPLSDLTHRLTYNDFRKDAEEVLKSLIPIERELQDDAGRWYLTRLLPYRSAVDRIEGVVITFIDIDTRKKAEQSLRASEERLRRMVNVEVVGILVFEEASGTLVDCNDAFLKMTGYTRKDVTSRKLTWRALTAPEYIEASEQEFQKLAQTGHIGPYEKEYFRQDRSRIWLIFAGATLGNGTAVEYCLDVSSRKRAEEDVRQAEDNLRIANDALLRANADLKHFSYAVSHDMQEPLRMVTSYTQLLAREFEGKLDARAAQYIEYAVRGSRRMEALLDDLRDYWTVGEQKTEEAVPLNCDRVLDRTLADLQTAIEESGAVVSRDPLPVVLAEPYGLQLLYQNLISNAIKYRRRDTKPHIHVSAEQSNGEWKFAVADNGIGIEAPHLQEIFAPFKRLHGGEYPGTGLGLAMCRKIVERYHGRIWVESTYGQGSTFKFTLPVLGGNV